MGILHDDQVRGMIDRHVWIAVDESTARKRRYSTPPRWPSKDEYFDECIWPAHKRHKAMLLGNTKVSAVPRDCDEFEFTGSTYLPQDCSVVVNGVDPPEQSAEVVTDKIRQWLAEQEQE